MRAVQDHTGSAVARTLEEQERKEATSVLEYYTNSFPEVYVLICDGCKEKLAIEYLDYANPNPNHLQARHVVPISNKLGSFRCRLDGVMGYKCACGNTTILSSVESGIVPVAKIMSDGSVVIPKEGMELHPHHKGMVEERIKSENYTPDIRLKGKDTIIETFRLRRIK